MDDIRIVVVGFNFHSTEILAQSGEEISDDLHTNFYHVVNYNFQNDDDFISNDPVNDGYLLSTPEDTTNANPIPDFRVASQQSSKDIKLIIDRKYHKKYRGRMH